MKPVKTLEFPPEQEAAFRQARRLEWISVGYLDRISVYPVRPREGGDPGAANGQSDRMAPGFPLARERTEHGLASAAVFLFLVMGNSQAMRTSFLEDVISLVPPIAFLVSARLATRCANKRFPYGMHTSVSIGYLTAPHAN